MFKKLFNVDKMVEQEKQRLLEAQQRVEKREQELKDLQQQVLDRENTLLGSQQEVNQFLESFSAEVCAVCLYHTLKKFLC